MVLMSCGSGVRAHWVTLGRHLDFTSLISCGSGVRAHWVSLDFIGISLGFHWLDLAPWACWEGIHFVRGRAGEVNGGPWRGEGEEAKKEDKEEEWKHAGWDHVEWGEMSQLEMQLPPPPRCHASWGGARPLGSPLALGGPAPPRCRRGKAGANGGRTSGSCRQEAEAGPTGAEAVTKSREAQNCTRSESRKSRESRKSGKNRKSRRKSRESGKSRKSRRKSGERRKSGKSRKRQKVERSQKNGATKISRNPERVPNEIRKRSENII